MSAFASRLVLFLLFFFFNDTATTEIYTLSLHDALPIFCRGSPPNSASLLIVHGPGGRRSEEHTSELQSLRHLVCRLLLEKKKKSLPRLQNQKQKKKKKTKTQEKKQK